MTTVVVYDATCGVCSTLVRVVERFGRPGEVRLVPRMSEEGERTIAAHWPGLAPGPDLASERAAQQALAARMVERGRALLTIFHAVAHR